MNKKLCLKILKKLGMTKIKIFVRTVAVTNKLKDIFRKTKFTSSLLFHRQMKE